MATKTPKVDLWQAGRQAALDGQDITDCPVPMFIESSHTVTSIRWIAGYRGATMIVDTYHHC